MLGLVELLPALNKCGALTFVRKVNSAVKENKMALLNVFNLIEYPVEFIHHYASTSKLHLI